MDGLALLTKAAAVTTPAVTEDDDDEVFVLSGDAARRDGTDGPRRRAEKRKRPAPVVETGPAAARAEEARDVGLGRLEAQGLVLQHERALHPLDAVRVDARGPARNASGE